MDALIQPLPFEPGSLAGLSARLLDSHHRNNYAGAVKRLNAIRGQLRALDFDVAPGFVLNGLKREELIAGNSMALHELYFASLGGDGQTMSPPMKLALEASFGSLERWRAEFVATGRALGGGSGWVLLCFQPREGTLVNQWCADHTHGGAGTVPILALDMYEHAYHLDFGAAAATYVDAFMQNIAWSGVYARYQAAVHAASEAYAATVDDVEHALILDVRRAGAFAQSQAMLPGATWRDPVAVHQWAAELPAASSDSEVIVYCVYGHEVSRAAALQLRAAGVNARFLVGGIEGLQARALPLVDKKPQAADGPR
ncbi:MAG TPA: Fe-Mn family superoxide dismutase [Rubrivivax sp.]|nr:Fe-Mn family superoxide dismutase [Rubrivivax sp.]